MAGQNTSALGVFAACLIILVMTNVFAPSVLGTFDTASINNTRQDFSKTNSSLTSIVNPFSQNNLVTTIVGIVFWNFNLSDSINLVLWLVRVLMLLSLYIIIIGSVNFSF